MAYSLGSPDRIRIVCDENNSRLAGSRIFLNDEDITPNIKDFKLYVSAETRRWTAEITFIASVDIEVSADMVLIKKVQG
jgi:hypothetical protein